MHWLKLSGNGVLDWDTAQGENGEVVLVKFPTLGVEVKTTSVMLNEGQFDFLNKVGGIVPEGVDTYALFVGFAVAAAMDQAIAGLPAHQLLRLYASAGEVADAAI